MQLLTSSTEKPFQIQKHKDTDAKTESLSIILILLNPILNQKRKQRPKKNCPIETDFGFEGVRKTTSIQGQLQVAFENLLVAWGSFCGQFNWWRACFESSLASCNLLLKSRPLFLKGELKSILLRKTIQNEILFSKEKLWWPLFDPGLRVPLAKTSFITNMVTNPLTISPWMPIPTCILSLHWMLCSKDNTRTSLRV